MSKRGKSGKGSAFEREISKYISSWLVDWQETKPLIWRSSNSGGTFTTNRRRGHLSQNSMASDLISIDEQSKWLLDYFAIECKNGYKGASVFATFKDCKTNILKSFWEQVNRDSSVVNKEPMLIFRQLGNQELIGLRSQFVHEKLKVQFIESYVKVKFKNDLPELMLFPMKLFFSSISADQLKQLVSS